MPPFLLLVGGKVMRKIEDAQILGSTPGMAPLSEAADDSLKEQSIADCYTCPAECPAGLECKECDHGKSIRECHSCPEGTFSHRGVSVCQACPAGMTSSSGSAACSACPAGSTAEPGDVQCSPTSMVDNDPGAAARCTHALEPGRFACPTQELQCACHVGGGGGWCGGVYPGCNYDSLVSQCPQCANWPPGLTITDTPAPTSAPTPPTGSPTATPTAASTVTPTCNDEDSCLQAHWGQAYTCEMGKPFCESYPQQMACCPKTCGTPCVPVTQEVAQGAGGETGHIKCPDGVTPYGIMFTYEWGYYCAMWSSTGVLNGAMYCQRYTAPSGAEMMVCTKAVAHHVNEMSFSAGVLVMKRVVCEGPTCNVFKTGLCIDVGEKVYSNYNETAADGDYLIGYPDGGVYNEYWNPIKFREANLRFAQLAENLLAKYGNPLPEQHQCRDDKHTDEMADKAYNQDAFLGTRYVASY